MRVDMTRPNAPYLRDLSRALDGAGDLSFLDGAHVLATGASGLIGSFFVDALMLANARGLNVRVCAMARDLKRLRARFEGWAGDARLCLAAGDLSRLDADLPGTAFDFILHAASPAHPVAFASDPVGTFKANVLGAMNLLERLRAQGRGRLVFLSSGEVYGQMRDGESDFDEKSCGYIDCALPRSCYPEGKRAAETLLAGYVSQYGVDALAARACYVYGAGITGENSRADAQFLRNALAGEDIVLKSAGSQVRTYLYVADAVPALIYLLRDGARGEPYNIADENAKVSIRAYAHTLARLAGVNLRVEAPDDTEKAGYSTVPRSTLRARKLLALGWRPRFSLEEGLAATLEIARAWR